MRRSWVFEGTERFRIVAPLGAGGMGAVFEAYDRDHDCHVALKVLPTPSPAEVMRFKNEFRSLHGIRHPNLVSLGELVASERHLFFTMELVRGVDIVAYVHGRKRRETFELSGAGAEEPTLRRDARSLLDWGPAAVSGPRTHDAGPVDFDRVRASFAQLTHALIALHAHHKVHRDVKPSNVLVTDEGRVVLLDFGLVLDLERRRSPHDDGLGTVSYLAPEQAAGAEVDARSDWYALGGMLYEALTGRPPFVGPPAEVLSRKLSDAPAPPSELADVPADLSELCCELLRRDAPARPNGDHVLAVLMPSCPKGDDTPHAWRSRSPTFVGRSEELGRLAAALNDDRAEPIVVTVEGESGIGKTSLVDEFLSRLAASHAAPLLVLRSRCSERELVPFKAFDAIVDEVARELARRISESETLGGTLVDAIAGASLAFPILGQLLDSSNGARSHDRDDALARRHTAFRSIRRLMSELSRDARVVLCVDDWQWADVDSIALLEAVLERPDPPGLRIVLVRRPDVGAMGFAVPAATERIELGCLSSEDAAQMAAELLRSSASTDLAREIAAESTGHPLFIRELATQLLGPERKTGLPPRLDDALWARFSALDSPSRRTLEMLVVAGSAISLVHLREAVAEVDRRITGIELLEAVTKLREASLLRSDGLRGADRVDCFHHRIAAALRSRLSETTLKACHEALALGSERRGSSDFDWLMSHWRAAGAADRAARYAVLAADRAMEALGFERAVELYRLAIELGASDPSAVLRKLGDALGHLGRGRASADAYLESAALSSDEHQVDLLRMAADQLFRSGYVDDAVELTRRVFARLDLSLPSSPRRAIVRLAVRRAQVRIRGTGFRRRDSSVVGARAISRVDASWSVAMGLSTVDNVRGAYLQSRHLLMALELGEPFRVLRALAVEAAYRATSGVRAIRSVDRLLSEADRLAAELGDGYALGFVHLARGSSRLLCGDFSLARASLEAAEAVLEGRPIMASWELASARMFALAAGFYLGDLAVVAERVPALIREAEARGDLYAATCLRTSVCNSAWLVLDRPDEARRNVVEADARWTHVGIHLQHYWSTTAWVNLELYDGNPEAAYERVERMAPLLRDAMLLGIELLRIELTWSRARAALALARADERRRPRLLAHAERCGQRLLGEKARWAHALGEITLAGVAHLRAQHLDERTRLRRGSDLARDLDLGMLAALARRLLGEESADRSPIARGAVVRPDRWAALLVPGFA